MSLIPYREFCAKALSKLEGTPQQRMQQAALMYKAYVGENGAPGKSAPRRKVKKVSRDKDDRRPVPRGRRSPSPDSATEGDSSDSSDSVSGSEESDFSDDDSDAQE
jgi:hypothetical protein